MVLTRNTPNSLLQQNKENALLKRTRLGAKHHYKHSHSSSSSSPAITKSTAPVRVTRKPRSRSHLSSSPLPTPSPRDVRKRVSGSEPEMVDVDIDMDMMDVISATPSSSRPAIQLPRTLKKPTFQPINRHAFELLDPELKGVPTDYVIDKLRLMGRGMLQAACTSTAQPPSNRLPRELEVMINDTTNPPPTHVFAVYTQNKKVTLHIGHGIVVAAHCTSLPPLPTPEFDPELSEGLKRSLPVVPLSLPSPNTFPILLGYLYTKQPQSLLNALLPPSQPSLTLSNPHASSSTPTQSNLAQTLARTYTTQALLAHAARVHGLWANMVALGVDDEMIWKIIHFVWGILINALELAAGGAQ
ncbi:hypothetical protein Clacol_007137 [Clathrus columnatus]|uniref:Uncharacterized protein n=1 Tax=Clathrus columnatus TaxID=1419009 RepID=A0AAV5AKA8_9AGAM|nr:hypothetical protein Clacol_007137 [Clathrus columnatus]